jgi:glycosyltransferase involved in cell wall biosynthesis
LRVAFLFSRPVHSEFDSIAIKQSHIARALRAKGVDVVWVSIEGHKITTSIENISVCRIETRFGGRLRILVEIGKLLMYCISTRVDCVYWDDWSFWRYMGARRVVLQLCLRILRIKHVQDERDPLVDFSLAERNMETGSRRYIKLQRNESLSHRLADLILLPSAAYAESYVRRGVSRNRVFGGFRGIDSKLFNPGVTGLRVREALNLSNRFVIGFVAHFNRYRLIEEVIIPLIETTEDRIPNCCFLIAGFGDLEERLREICDRHSQTSLFIEYIPYQEVPEYLAACDMTLSPLDVRFEHSLNAISLKIVESLMVGRPVVATRNLTSDADFRGLKGVVWVGSDLKSFQDAIAKVAANASYYSVLAQVQATNMGPFSTKSTIPLIVDKIIEACGG